MAPPLLVAVMGTTSSGKTALAEELADRLGAALLNADAFQIYRGMDVGTAKSPRKAEYRLMDIRTPDQGFGVGEYARLAAAELTALHTQGRHAVMVGGTGLYIRAVTERYDAIAPEPDPELRATLRRRLAEDGLEALARELAALDPAAASRIDLRNPHRVLRALERHRSPVEPLVVAYPLFRVAKFAIDLPVEEVNRRIERRAWEMTENGWAEEVISLREAGYRPEMPGFRAHGYREMWRVVHGELGLAEAMAATIAQVQAYAKRQRTWMRREPGLTMLPGDAGPAERAWDALLDMGEVC